MNINRFKNAWMWLGLIGVIVSAAGIDPTTLTSWNVLFNNIMEIVKNPYLLVSTIMAVIGVLINPNTKGISDK